MNVKFLNEYAKLPTKGSAYAAGYDLYAAINEPMAIFPGSTVPVTTGLAMEIPEDLFGAIFARSGLATKRGLRPANCVGVVDADYRGEIHVDLVNHGHKPFRVECGMRIAQLVIARVIHATLNPVDDLDTTERNDHGHGSTGIY